MAGAVFRPDEAISVWRGCHQTINALPQGHCSVRGTTDLRVRARPAGQVRSQSPFGDCGQSGGGRQAESPATVSGVKQ